MLHERPPKGGGGAGMASAPALDVTTSLLGDFVENIVWYFAAAIGGHAR